MTVATRLTDASSGEAARGRRAKVIAALRASDRPLSAAEVAAATGLRFTTARFHLDGLVDDGLAERAPEPRDVPGRPRILYSARAAAPGPRSYALLAEMLTGLVANLPGGKESAVEAGKAWGRYLIERPAPSERVDAAEAVARLNRMLDAMGFAPDVQLSADGTEVRLHNCPFREVAEKHGDVVCRIHLGLMQGALAELEAPVETTSLEPFVTQQRCVARLARTTTD